MSKDVDLFIHNNDEKFLELGDTLKTPNRFGDPLDDISNRICKLVKNDCFGTIIEINGEKHSIWDIADLSLTKETKIKTLTKQIELMEFRLKKKKDELKALSKTIENKGFQES